jgi:hypothetical protein
MFVIARVHGLTPLLPHFFLPTAVADQMALGRYMIGLYHYSSHSLLMRQSPFPCLFLEVCSTGTAWTLRSHQFSLSRHSAIGVIHLNELRATRKHDAVELCPAASALFRWDAFGHARYYPPRLEWPPFTENYPVGYVLSRSILSSVPRKGSFHRKLPYWWMNRA